MLRAILVAGLKRPRQPRAIQIRSATGRTEATNDILVDYVNGGVKLDPVDSPNSEDLWQTTTKNILDQSIYPIGFTTPTNLQDKTGVGENYEPSVWKVELSKALDGVKPHTHRTGFELLDRLQFENINNHGNDSPLIKPETLRWVLNCWKTSLSHNSTNNQLSPEAVWSKVRSYYASRIVLHEDLTLAIVIDSFDLYYKLRDAAPRAMRMIDDDDGNDSPIPLEASSISNLLQLWRHSRLPEAALEASGSLLARTTTPTPSMLATALTTWTAYGDADEAADRAERYLQQEVDDPTLSAAALHALANAGRMERAHHVLYQWIQAEQSHCNDDRDALKTLRDRAKRFPVASIMLGYKNRLEKQPIVALEQLEAFNKEMEELADKGAEWSVLVRPNLECHQIMVSAYAQIGKPRMAEEKVRRVMLQYGSREKWTKNKKRTFVAMWNSVMDAWIQSGDASAFSQCTMIVHNLAKDKLLYPNLQSYNTLLKCLSETEMKAHQKAKEINSILLRAGRIADGSTYTIAIQLLGNAGYPRAAKSLLNNMMTVGIKPQNEHFISVMAAFLPVAKKEGRALQILADLIYALERANEKNGVTPKVSILALTIYLEALSYSSKTDAVKRAHVKFMTVMAWKLPLNPAFCTAVMSVYLRSKKLDSAREAARIFSTMKESHTADSPTIDANTWTTLTAIYGKYNMASEAEELFNEMKNAEDPSLHPTFLGYATMLNAYGLGGQPKAATSLLEEFLARYEDGHFGPDERPYTTHFNTVLRSWLNSGLPEAASEIEDRITKMHDLAAKFNCQPDLVSYSIGIQACTEDPERVLRLYSRLTDQYNSSGSPRPHLSIYRDVVAVMTKMTPVPVRDLHGILADMVRYTSAAVWRDESGSKLAQELLFHLSNADIEERDHERLRYEVLVMLHKYREENPIEGVDLSDVVESKEAATVDDADVPSLYDVFAKNTEIDTDDDDDNDNDDVVEKS